MRCLFIHHKKYHFKWPEIFRILINDKAVFTYDKYTENDQDIFSDNVVFSFIEDDSPQKYFSSSNENIFSVSDYFKRGENTLTFENNSSDKANVGTSNSS